MSTQYSFVLQINIMKSFTIAALALLPTALAASYDVTAYTSLLCNGGTAARDVAAAGTQSTDCIAFSGGISFAPTLTSCTASLYTDDACGTLLKSYTASQGCDSFRGISFDSFKVTC